MSHTKKRSTRLRTMKICYENNIFISPYKTRGLLSWTKAPNFPTSLSPLPRFHSPHADCYLTLVLTERSSGSSSRYYYSETIDLLITGDSGLEFADSGQSTRIRPGLSGAEPGSFQLHSDGCQTKPGDKRLIFLVALCCRLPLAANEPSLEDFILPLFNKTSQFRTNS